MVKNVCQTYLKGLKEFYVKLFLALALASGATRPHLGVPEHRPNTHFQGLKIDLCGYRCPNYFSRSVTDIPPEKEHYEVVFHKSEEWKAQHVCQLQYMLQIIKCSDSPCCKPWRTNYPMFFSKWFLPAPVPISTSDNGLKIDPKKGSFCYCFNPFI